MKKMIDITSIVDGDMNTDEIDIGYKRVLDSIIEINRYLTGDIDNLSPYSNQLLDSILSEIRLL